MKPLVLCIHMEPAKLMRMSMLALSLGIQVKEVRQEDWGQRLAALCGLEAMKKRTPEVQVGEEMLVMAFFPDDLLDALFLAMRKNGLSMPPHRAILTPTNRAWHCGRLYEELNQEYMALTGRKGPKA